MPPSVYPARSSERIRFRELFRDTATVQRNGGVLVGAPEIKGGIVLDGTQRCTHSISSTALATPELAFVLEFVPDFEHNDNIEHYFFDTTNGARYYALKANTNILYVTLADVLVASIAPAVWAAHWVVGGRNVLVISSDHVTTYIWLNGHVILAGAAVAWVPKYPTSLYTGASFADTFPFVGIINTIDVHGCLLEQGDVAGIQDGSLWRYSQRVNLALDMETATASAGTIRGTAELLVDGDQETAGTAAWVAASGGIINKRTDGPYSGIQYMRITGVTNGLFRQAVSAVSIVRRHRVRGWARSDGVNTASVIDASIGTVLWDSTTSTDWQHFDITVIPSSALGFAFRWRLGAGTHVDFDDLETFETDELLDDASMEATRVGEWTVQNNATLTKETGSPYQGLQVMRIAYNGINYPMAYQSILVLGRTYRATGRARGDSVRAPAVLDATTVYWTGTASTAWQYFDITFTSTGTSFKLRAVAIGAGYVEFDDVSVRPVLDRTLDKSRSGYPMLLGDGFTAASIPTFLGTGKGFGLDGIAQHLICPVANGIYGTPKQSIVFVFRPRFNWDINSLQHFFDATTENYLQKRDNASANVLRIVLGGTFIADIPAATYSPHWRTGGVNIVVILAESGSTDVRLNGHLILAGDVTVWTPVDVDEIYIGARNDLLVFFDGDVLLFGAFPLKLSSLQAKDLLLQLGGTA